MPYYVYLLRCADQSLYTGIASDVLRRLAVHNSGRGAKYTRSRLPVALAYVEESPDRSAALRREYALKRLSHAEKEALIRSAAANAAQNQAPIPAPRPAAANASEAEPPADAQGTRTANPSAPQHGGKR